MICSSRFLNRLSCRTFFMATTSPVSTTFASNTTPNDPFPMMRSAEYDMFCSGADGPRLEDAEEARRGCEAAELLILLEADAAAFVSPVNELLESCMVDEDVAAVTVAGGTGRVVVVFGAADTIEVM